MPVASFLPMNLNVIVPVSGCSFISVMGLLMKLPVYTAAAGVLLSVSSVFNAIPGKGSPANSSV